MKNDAVKTVKISLEKSEQVKRFVSLVEKYDYKIELSSGDYNVDAKSILGVFSLDHSKPVTVKIHSVNCDDLLEKLKTFTA